MNLDLHREHARRRRLIQRTLAHQQQRHRQEVRSGMVPPVSSVPASGASVAGREFRANGRLPDAPALTLLVQAGAWTLMAAVAVQHRDALAAVVLRLAAAFGA